MPENRKIQKTRLGVMLGIYADMYQISGSQIGREAGIPSQSVNSIMTGKRGATGTDAVKIYLWMTGTHSGKSDMVMDESHIASTRSNKELEIIGSTRRRRSPEAVARSRARAKAQPRAGGKFAKKGEGTEEDVRHITVVAG